MRFRSVQIENLSFWLLAVALGCLGVWLRISGPNWDDGQLLHPDERFLVMVTSALKIVNSWAEYFDTANSTLNPHNMGYGFYVYGTFPLFLWRYLADLLGPQAEIHLIGRSISAAFDFGTCLLTFASAWVLFGRWAGLIAFFVSITTVLQIQLAHFGAFDSHGTFLTSLVLFISILIARRKPNKALIWIILAGISCGLAAATKINLALVFILIPAAIFTGGFSEGWPKAFAKSFSCSLIAFLFFLITFRLFQPYAFEGPGFMGLHYNPKWIDNLRSLSGQIEADFGFPPAVQWYNRTRLHGFLNLVSWGLALPIGIASMLALFFAGYKIFSKDLFNSKFFIPFIWAISALAVYVVSPKAQPIRYGEPAYPALQIILAGTIWQLLDIGPVWLQQRWREWEIVLIRAVIAVVLISSLLWSLAFTSIYREDNSRVAASKWMLSELPGVINFVGFSDEGQTLLPLPIAGENKVIALPLAISVGSPIQFSAREILIPKIVNSKDGESLIFEITDDSGSVIAKGEGTINKGRFNKQFELPININRGHLYKLAVSKAGPGSGAHIERPSLGRESSWDDGLPLRVMGFDPYGGIYDGNPNIEIYWRDTEIKAGRIAESLSKSDYFYLSSNRQVGSIGRLPKDFPIAALFYQKLLGCSAREDIPACYAKVKEGQRSGELGFELIKVFESYPKIFGITFNSQSADEAFHVYDHPKVLIFRNRDRLDRKDLEKLLTPVKLY